MRRMLNLAWGTVAISAVAGGICAAQLSPHPAPKSGYADITNNLIVEPPVDIHGPYPPQRRQVRAGDMVLLQIRYPIAPPMPKSVAVSADHQLLKPLTAVTTSGPVAVLERKAPSDGKLGVGYVQVLMQCVRGGMDDLTVHLKLGDGSVKNVPFSFEVK
jgi:hypothetical protein